MRHAFRFAIILAILLCAGARAWAQPATRVLYPRMTQPAVVVLDEKPSFVIQHAPDLSIQFAALSGPAEIDSKDNAMGIIANPDQTSATAIVLPETMPAGLYTLHVTATLDGETMTETIPRSVWVLAQAPQRLVFAHLADTHTGDPRAAMSPSAETPDQRREKVFGAACASGADFVIITGDIVSVPGNYKKEYKQAYQELEQDISCPLFLVPGNHDQYTTHATKTSADGLTFWTHYFGDDKYGFSLGNYAFVVTNSYDWPRKYRNFMDQPLMEQVGSYASGAMSLTQFQWLDTMLTANDGKHTLVFGHHLFRDYSTKNSAIPDLAAPDDVLSLLARHGVKYYFAGHNHRNTRETINGVTLSTVVSAASDIPENASWGFDKCTVDNDTVTCEFIPVVSRTD